MTLSVGNGNTLPLKKFAHIVSKILKQKFEQKSMTPICCSLSYFRYMAP